MLLTPRANAWLKQKLMKISWDSSLNSTLEKINFFEGEVIVVCDSELEKSKNFYNFDEPFTLNDSHSLRRLSTRLLVKKITKILTEDINLNLIGFTKNISCNKPEYIFNLAEENSREDLVVILYKGNLKNGNIHALAVSAYDGQGYLLWHKFLKPYINEDQSIKLITDIKEIQRIRKSFKMVRPNLKKGGKPTLKLRSYIDFLDKKYANLEEKAKGLYAFSEEEEMYYEILKVDRKNLEEFEWIRGLQDFVILPKGKIFFYLEIVGDDEDYLIWEKGK